MQNNNAQGVVPGYQPLRSNAPRSNTAGKHSAQQQLNPHAAGPGPLPTTSNGQRPGHQALKFKKQASNQDPIAGSALIGQQYQPHSNPNFADQQAAQAFEKSSKPLDRSDPQLQKAMTGQHGASPRPGAPGQIQIQQIIRNHQMGGNGQQQLLQQTVNTGGKSKSSNQRPLRSSRQQISPSIVTSLHANANGQRGNPMVQSLHGSPFDASNILGKGGPNSSRLPGHSQHVVAQSMTQNQTPNISNFHPPAIQKHDGGASSSRRNARHAQINKNHPDLVVQNSQSGPNQISYSYSKRNNNAAAQSQQMQGFNMQPGQVASTQQQEKGGKFVRPNTASETRKFMQQQQLQENGNNTQPTVTSPLVNSRQGLVPQPATLTHPGQTQEGILAASSRNRRGGAADHTGFPNSTTNQQNSRDGKSMNPMSLSHDQPLPHRRQAKEDTLFPDKKQGATATPNGLNLQVNPHQQQLNTIGGFGSGGGGHTERGPASSRIPVSQTLDAYGRNNAQGMNSTHNGPANSASHINPLIPGQSSHQRITSQHNQTIPQYRKANLRDLRKSQRLSNGTKDKKMYEDPGQQNNINPLTSVELNQHFAGKRGHGGSNAVQKAAANSSLQSNIQKYDGGQFQKSSRGKETNRSLDTAKRQLLIPSNSGMGNHFGQVQGNSHQLTGPVNKSLQPGSSQNQQQANNHTSLLPSGYKRRSKRPGQSLNQVSLNYSHQGNLTGVYPDGGQGAKEQTNSHQNNRNKRLELSTINHVHQRGPNDALSSERNKHSRQKNMMANSLDGAFPKRIPSVHSIKRGDSDNNDQKEPSKSNDTPKHKEGGNDVQPSNERFNAITKFAFATSCGHQPGNPYKVNQDTYTLAPNMCGQQGFHLFVVCDGHGVNGHKVSGDIKIELPKELEAKLQNDKDFLENTASREFSERIPRYFRDAFDTIHANLMNNKSYDCHLSGSTVTAVLFDSLRIYCANAGDSRAVLYTQGKKGGLKVTPLSEDHKPSLPKEKARVDKMGGRVNPIIGPQGQHLGPDRVWLLNEDTPGLAMSRSLGDGLAHSVGVSWEPEVKQLVLEPSDKFIVIASDGVWEFLSNEQIARIVWPYYIKNSPEQAGNAIVRASAQKWKENDTVIDDITCITIFLEVD